MNTSALKPKVSVVTPTYNQEKYIRQALDSFISQKTDFDFEIIVADDCSTDRTPNIIEEYAQAHPGIITPIIRKKNIGVGANFKEALSAARGQYIALCEGDDYWTDPQKLQLQVDFMDEHPDYALCFHPVKVIFENNEQPSYVYPDPKQGSEFTVEALLQTNYIQTNSVVYRCQSYQAMPVDILPVDWYLHLYHARFGKVGFIDRTMSVYRRHPGGVWWDSHSDREKFWKKNGLAHLAMYDAVLHLYSDNERRQVLVYQPISEAVGAFMELAGQDNTLLREAVERFPELVQIHQRFQAARLADYTKQQKAQDEHIAALQHSVESSQQAADLKDHHIRNLETELAAIKSSRGWRTIQMARGAKTKLKRKRTK